MNRDGVTESNCEMLPDYSKLKMFWLARIEAALKNLQKALADYTEFHDKGIEGFKQ